MSDIEPLKIYAWVGEDEFGSGEVGLKQGEDVAGNVTALAATDADKLKRYADALQKQSNQFGKTIRLIECREWHTILTLRPKP